MKYLLVLLPLVICCSSDIEKRMDVLEKRVEVLGKTDQQIIKQSNAVKNAHNALVKRLGYAND